MSCRTRLCIPLRVVGLVTFSLLLVSTCCLTAGESSPSAFVLENKYISYGVELREGEKAEVTIVNKGLGEKHVFESPLFMVLTENRLADITRSRVHKVTTSGSADEAQTAVLSTTCERAGLSIAVLYELYPDEFFVKKTLAISKLEPGEVVVNRIDVDILGVPEPDRVVEFEALGQPVYYRDLFFGVEYPACTILCDGRGRIRVGYEYGLPVGLTPVSSHAAVIGVAGDGDVSKSFLRYVDTIRSRPPRPFVLWNSWYNLREFDEEACLESVRLLREKFCNPYGIRLDAIVLDDGWDDHRSLWRVAKDRFPSGFTKIEDESLKIASGLGFWLSPWGGYGEGQKERIAYGSAEGFELLKSPGFRREGFCLAAPRYKARFQECGLGFLRDYKTTYFKFDGFPSFCQDPLHGHRVGLYSQVAMTDAFIDVLDSLKKEKRGLFINITTGTWHSPWWLQHADSVWMQGNDYGHDGWGSVRQRSITYKDWWMHIAFREKKAQYPFNALMTVGIVKGRYNIDAYRTPDKDESEKDWQDHVMMNLGMGTLHLELYISPAIMSDKELAFLGGKIRWWLENARVFAHTKMILGNPHEGEVYAYTHFPQDGQPPHKGLIFVRNPSLEKKKAEIPFDDSIDLPKGAARVKVRSIYPGEGSSWQEVGRGEGLSLGLEPLETRVVEVNWGDE
jgi:hypothetical protein